jgi:hypothetical protein
VLLKLKNIQSKVTVANKLLKLTKTKKEQKMKKKEKQKRDMLILLIKVGTTRFCSSLWYR